MILPLLFFNISGLCVFVKVKESTCEVITHSGGDIICLSVLATYGTRRFIWTWNLNRSQLLWEVKKFVFCWA